MQQDYKKLLKELEKGNAVLLEAAGLRQYPRYRLITPSNCEFIFVDFFADSKNTNFSKSCFLDYIPQEKLTPEIIINRMQAFDKKLRLEIRKMQVLK